MENGRAYKVKWLGYNDQINLSATGLPMSNHHDLVWGWLQMDDKRIFTFWGTRGKQIITREFSTGHFSFEIINELRKLVNKQRRKKYKVIDPDWYIKFFDSNFYEHLECGIMITILTTDSTKKD